MKKITLEELVQLTSNDEALRARLDAMPDPDALKAAVAELGYDLELPEGIIEEPDDAIEHVTGGDSKHEMIQSHQRPPECEKGGRCNGRRTGIGRFLGNIRYFYKCSRCGKEYWVLYRRG